MATGSFVKCGCCAGRGFVVRWTTTHYGDGGYDECRYCLGRGEVALPIQIEIAIADEGAWMSEHYDADAVLAETERRFHNFDDDMAIAILGGLL